MKNPVLIILLCAIGFPLVLISLMVLNSQYRLGIPFVILPLMLAPFAIVVFIQLTMKK